jgi:hypothetical protein
MGPLSEVHLHIKRGFTALFIGVRIRIFAQLVVKLASQWETEVSFGFHHFNIGDMSLKFDVWFGILLLILLMNHRKKTY